MSRMCAIQIRIKVNTYQTSNILTVKSGFKFNENKWFQPQATYLAKTFETLIKIVYVFVCR